MCFYIFSYLHIFNLDHNLSFFYIHKWHFISKWESFINIKFPALWTLIKKCINLKIQFLSLYSRYKFKSFNSLAYSYMSQISWNFIFFLFFFSYWCMNLPHINTINPWLVDKTVIPFSTSMATQQDRRRSRSCDSWSSCGLVAATLVILFHPAFISGSSKTVQFLTGFVN